MAKKTDAVTRWWRGTSLRAKVTGVTVAVLAAGLLAAGIGTVPFLRGTLVANIEQSVEQLVISGGAAGLIEVTNADGVLHFTPNPDAAPTDYFVAVYGPTGERELITGGAGGDPPKFPETFSPADTLQKGTSAFSLENGETGAQYKASADYLKVPGTSDLYTQIVALPLASVNRFVATYLGIFGIVALITMIGGALITRWLVTLTFRGLGQVETTAMSIASGDFSQRLTDIEPGTEVGRLKIAINTMLGRVDASLSQRDATVRQMRRFIGDASHELRTPLVTVRGYAELYRMGAIQGDDDTAQAMERIEKEAIRMGVLVEDLLALARLDERREVDIAAVDLRPVARDAALDVRAASPRRAVTVIDTTVPSEPPAPEPAGTASAPGEPPARRRAAAPTSAIALAGATLSLLRRRSRPVPATSATTSADAAVGAGAAQPPLAPLDLPEASVEGSAPIPPIVLGDENRIRQVVANLLGNARRFTAEDSPIELELGVDARIGMASIAVIDHGEGIPEQIREQIFQRFWRADTSRARETGGSGLGLSIVASIVEALHGSVAVEETSGGGATFRVWLPLANERDAAEHLLIETQPLPRLRPVDLDPAAAKE